MKLLQKIIHFIMMTTYKYGLDESHGMMHSFDTLHTSDKIIKYESINFPELIEQQNIVYVSAALHDMCDKKYMNEEEGIEKIENLLKEDMSKKEINVVHDIVGKMSYSKVKKYGFPDMGNYQAAYNVVREADLLCAYDFNRAMIYSLYKRDTSIEEAYKDTFELFLKRMFKHNDDGLFTFDYTKERANELKYHSLRQMKQWKRIMKALHK